MNKKYALCGMIVFLALAAAAAAQTPNFSGQWKSVRTTIDPDPGYVSLPDVVMDIKHEGLVLEFKTTTLNSQIPAPPVEHRYTTDRKEATSPAEGGGDLKSLAFIESGKLIIEGEAEAKSARIAPGEAPEISYVRYRYHEEWSLSEDGKTLTIVRKIEREDMPMVMTTVLTKGA